MKAGDIIRIPLPQSDGIVKPRPVLLLKKLPPFGDWLVCGITSKLRHEVKDFDILITDNNPEFKYPPIRRICRKRDMQDL